MKLPLMIIGFRVGTVAAIALGSLPSVSAIEPYGSPYPLSQEEATVLHYLAWPQSRQAITSRIGFPNGYDERFDYYNLPSGGYLAVEYRGSTAVGFERGF